jgi:hypothetical protein
MKVDHTLVSGNTAVVEMTSTSTALNGKAFPNTYCWVVLLLCGPPASAKTLFLLGISSMALTPLTEY